MHEKTVSEVMDEVEYQRLYQIYIDEYYYPIMEFGKFVDWYYAKEKQKLAKQEIAKENKKRKFFGEE